MSNLTIAVDDNIVKLARVRAIQQGTSVSAKVREFLASYAQGETLPNPQLAAGQAFMTAALGSSANTEGVAWVREDAYDRVYPGAAHPTSTPS